MFKHDPHCAIHAPMNDKCNCKTLYAVLARTARTDWVELNVFETRDEAVKECRDIQDKDKGVELCIEER